MDLYQIFSSCSLCDIILNYKISAHFHNICMDFPQFQSAKWDIYEERYSEKTNYSKHIHCFLQLHVPYTLVGAIAILKFVETGLIFCNDKSLKKIGIFQLDALRCKFALIQ